MLRISTALAVFVLLLLVAGAWLLADLNRFRPQAEAALGARIGSGIRIEGDLGWRLLPAPALTAASIAAADGSWWVERGSLQLLEWGVALDGVGLRAAAFADLGIKKLGAQFAAGDGAPRIGLRAEEILGGSGWADIGVPGGSRPGEWTLELQTEGLRAAALKPWFGPQVRWEGALNLGCQLRLAEGGKHHSATARAAGDLGVSPTRASPSSNRAPAAATVAEGASVASASGQGTAIAATTAPVTAESSSFEQAGRAVVDLRRRLAGKNGWAALAADLSGQCRLAGKAGRIQAPALNKLLAAAARLAGDFREAGAAALDYRQLRGEWTIAGSKHGIQASLDNLTVTAEGEYFHVEDILDFSARLTLADPGEQRADAAELDASRQTAIPALEDAAAARTGIAAGRRRGQASQAVAGAAGQSGEGSLANPAGQASSASPASPRGLLAINPVLVGLPIPVRCRGAIRSPRCGLDVGAFAAQLAAMAQAGEGSAQARQLEAVIEGAVPPKYRKAAASLLKLLAQGHGEDD